MAIFYKNIDTPRSPIYIEKPIEVGKMNIKSELEHLQKDIESETNLAKRKELQRKLNRMKRFDRLQDGTDIKDENTKQDIEKILK